MIPDKDYFRGSVFELKFPDELYGEVIDDIDVTILNSDSLRLIDAYVKQGCELSDIQWKVLQQCESELKTILPQLSDQHKNYFKKLYEHVHDIVVVINKRENKL